MDDFKDFEARYGRYKELCKVSLIPPLPASDPGWMVEYTRMDQADRFLKGETW